MNLAAEPRPSLQRMLAGLNERYLNLLWDQWVLLGLFGKGSTDHGQPYILDPEAMLLATMNAARTDPRLFDEVIDWVRKNEQFLSPTRMKRMATQHGFEGTRLLAAAMNYALADSPARKRWEFLAKDSRAASEEVLFLNVDGSPLLKLTEGEQVFQSYGFLRGAVRTKGLSRAFPQSGSGGSAAILLRLRALIGVSSKAELLALLRFHGMVAGSEAARLIYFGPRQVQEALAEMAASGSVSFLELGNTKVYRLTHPESFPLVIEQMYIPRWYPWAYMYRVLEVVIGTLRELLRRGFEDVLIASELRRRLLPHIAPMVQAGVRNPLYPEFLMDEKSRTIGGFLERLATGLDLLLSPLESSDHAKGKR